MKSEQHKILHWHDIHSSIFRDAYSVDWKRMKKSIAQSMPEDAKTLLVYTSDGWSRWKRNKWGGYGLHCEDGPARISIKGKKTVKVYVQNGKCHRDVGPASIILEDKRDIGEGIVTINFEYCVNDKWHREDGPAIMQLREDGSKREAWYLAHKFIKQKIT